jgi:hypothetical protein
LSGILLLFFLTLTLRDAGECTFAGGLFAYSRAFLLDASSVVPEPASGLTMFLGAVLLSGAATADSENAHADVGVIMGSQADRSRPESNGLSRDHRLVIRRVAQGGTPGRAQTGRSQG